MQSLPYHRRNYKLLEQQCLDLFSIVVIDDNNFDQPNSTYAALIHDIVPLIESLAKDLHQELAQTDLAKLKVEPKLQEYKAKERFDFEALAFLDQALGLSSKQVKLTSELVALAEESGHRILIPLQGAHDKDKTKHPLWSRAYQSYKHNQANTQQDSADCPTAQALLEAIGAAFLLLTVANYLPITREMRFNKCDFSFGSELFVATSTRASINSKGLTGPMNPDCIQLDKNWKQAMFVVRDSESLIKYLRAESQKRLEQIKHRSLRNPTFLAFYKNHAEGKNTCILHLLSKYGQETYDPKERQWSKKLLKLTVAEQSKNFLAWNHGFHYQLSQFGFDPVVALNYKDASDLYDYKKLNQDSPEVQQQ